jgi:3-oxoadipate enol-lactonase
MRDGFANYSRERPNSHRSIEVDGATLSIIDEGSPDAGSPQLFIQGLGCEAETIWRPLLSELVAAGDERQHIAFDTRGIGSSSGWPDSLEQMADDAATVLACCTTSPAEVVGHSLGGAVAMLLAARHPSVVRSLIIMDSVPEYSKKSRSGFRWRAGQIRDVGAVATIFDIVIPHSFGNKTHTERPEVVARFQDMLGRQSPDVYSHICELAASTNVWSEFNSLRLPTLFVSGSEDVSTSSDIMRPLAEQIGGRFVEIPNAGHNPPLEQPAYVAAAILEHSNLHSR